MAIDDVKWGVGSTGSAKQGDRRGRKPRYPETARLWNQNFEANRDWILQLGNPYDQRFLRMWSYYLQLLRGVLDSGDLQLYQVLFGQQSSRPRQRVSISTAVQLHRLDHEERRA